MRRRWPRLQRPESGFAVVDARPSLLVALIAYVLFSVARMLAAGFAVMLAAVAIVVAIYLL